MNVLRHLPAVTLVAAVSLLSACGGGSGGSTVQPPVQHPASNSKTLSLKTTGTPQSLPSIGGISSSIVLPSNSAASNATLTVTVTTTAPSTMVNVPANSAQPLLYLTLEASSDATFNGVPTFTITLPSPPQSQGAFYAWTYDATSKSWTDFGPVNISGSQVTFGGTLTAFTIQANAENIVVPFIAAPAAACPTPTPAPPALGTWSAAASMPTARALLGSGVIDGRILAIGGSTALSPPYISTVEVYDPTTNTWTSAPPMPTARYGFAAGVINGVLYAVGGQDNAGNILSTVEAFDPRTNIWTTKAPMPTPRFALGAAVVGNTLYAIGGFASNISHVVEAYDATTNTWTTKAPVPQQRQGLAAAALNGIIYAVGGNCCTTNLATVEAYDPATNTWTEKAPMAEGRVDLGLGVIGNALYAVGGVGHVDNHGDVPLSSVEAYDPDTNTWTAKAPMPTARFGLTAATLGGKLYAIGGENANSFLNTVEVYTP